MKRFAVMLCLLPVCLAEIRTGRFQNRDSWVVDTPSLRVRVMQSGGHVAEIVLKGGAEVNPLWVQKRATIDADKFDPARHVPIYGTDKGARVRSGLAGHNLCFPFWGDPSDAEFKAGMTFHGETGIVRWTRAGGGSDTLVVSAELPESRTKFTRSLRVKGQVVYFDEVAENLSKWDRPVGWTEHVTLGPPFLEKAVTLMDASLTRGRPNGDASGREFAWPGDLRTVQNVAASGFVDNFLVDPAREFGFFAAVNPGMKLLIGYIFRRRDFPWLSIWEANNPDMLTRGMEFSNTPTHGTMKALVKTPELFGAPAYEWLDGKGRIEKRYAAFSVRVPEGYRGVADVRVTGNRLEIVERETGRLIGMEFDPLVR